MQERITMGFLTQYRSLPALALKVLPGASRDKLSLTKEGQIKIAIAASPEKDKANDRLTEFLAEMLDVKPSSVTIVQGQKARTKVVTFSQGTAEELERKLASFLKDETK